MLHLMGSVWALVTHTSCKHLCREKYSLLVMLLTEVVVLSINEVPFLGK